MRRDAVRSLGRLGLPAEPCSRSHFGAPLRAPLLAALRGYRATYVYVYICMGYMVVVFGIMVGCFWHIW